MDKRKVDAGDDSSTFLLNGIAGAGMAFRGDRGSNEALSICQYVNGDYSIGGLLSANLRRRSASRSPLLSPMVYFCSGTDAGKADWFRTINIAGEEIKA